MENQSELFGTTSAIPTKPLEAGTNQIIIAKNCNALLQKLTQAEMINLAHYARSRLVRSGLPLHLAEDLRQNAFLAVLTGSQSNLHGRHPRAEHLANQDAFIKYLEGIICSLVEARCRKRESKMTFVCVDEAMLGSGGLTTDEHAASEDLAEHLFIRLQQRVPKHLLPTVLHWAGHWRESAVIPLSGKPRRHRQELRALAANVLSEVLSPILE